jgi:hypothetical protein
MPINMTLAALLMSGAVQSGEPATKPTPGAGAISQHDGGAPLVLAQTRLPGKPDMRYKSNASRGAKTPPTKRKGAISATNHPKQEARVIGKPA